MLAVFKTGGKQYSVKAGQILKVEKLKGKKGDIVSFNNVLAISNSSQNTIGTPVVEGALVEAKILDQIRNDKIIVFKKRRRQNYRSTQGHRQYLTVLKIESISIGNKKSELQIKTDKKIISKTKEKKEGAGNKKNLTKKTSPKKTILKKTTVVKKTTKKATVKKRK